MITVSFAEQSQTKTTLEDGLQPKFADGDSILLVSYPNGPTADAVTEIRDVKVENNVATISTDLTGPLRAFYPAKYVGTEDKIGFSVPAEQSGKFEDANFAGANINENDDKATFTNVTALFIVTPPANTKKLIIKSLKDVEDGVQRTGEYQGIQNSNKSVSDIITIGDGSADIPSPCYIALMHGVKLSNLSFEAEFEAAGTGSIKGIPTSKIAALAGGAVGSTAYDSVNTVKYGTAYTIDSNNWHPYVTVANRKWATVNIGASTPQEAGEYFAWGGTTGYVRNQADDGWCQINADGDSLGLDGGFCWAKCPYTYREYTAEDTSVFTKYTAERYDYASGGTADGKSVLDLEDDAANVKWGGAWRMPTQTEFSAMISKCSGAFDSGQHFGDNDSSPQIFLPAAGYGSNTALGGENSYGVYWSSSLGSTPAGAYFLAFSGGGAAMGDDRRSYGHPIRAIVDDPDYIATED